MNESINQSINQSWIYIAHTRKASNDCIRLTEKNMTVNETETPRHDNCVLSPVSWVTIRLEVTVIDYVVKTNITDKSCLVIKRNPIKTHTRNMMYAYGAGCH